MDHPTAPLPPKSAARRRNSIAASIIVPEKLCPYVLANPTPNRKPGAALPPLDLEFLSVKTSRAYTSLKDVLPAGAAVNSPTASTPNGYEISIRNRLVKQAAWAYLQPMSASPSCSDHGYFHRLRHQIAGSSPISACISFINRHIFSAVTRVVNRILRVIGVRINR